MMHSSILLAPRSLLLLLSLALIPAAVQGQAKTKNIDIYSCNALKLAQTIAGTSSMGATVINATLTGKPIQGACFRNGNYSIGYANGIVLSTGNAKKADPDFKNVELADNLNGPGFPFYPYDNNRDAAVLTIEFKCPEKRKKVSVGYIFGSNEGEEDPTRLLDDGMGIFLNGKTDEHNIAKVDGYKVSAYYPVMEYDSEYVVETPSNFVNVRRYTIPLQTLKVQGKDRVNTITIVVADAGLASEEDYSIPSYVFIRSSGLRCTT